MLDRPFPQNDSRSRVLILGASGMLGHTVLRVFAESLDFQAFGSVRTGASLALLPKDLRERVYSGIDVESSDSLVTLFGMVRPTVVINCIGLVKQLAGADDPLAAIPINALLPHRLARLCSLADARFIHVSTDCVFSGIKGMYAETDASDAQDLYGKSKFLGEVDYPHAITLRTSIIGHELGPSNGLIGWFLAQTGEVQGYRRAVFSGLPTVELARVIRDFVLPRPALTGIYHVAANPTNKFDLLRLVSNVYEKAIRISPNESVVIDRSLDAARFSEATGYRAPPWPALVKQMHAFG